MGYKLVQVLSTMEFWKNLNSQDKVRVSKFSDQKDQKIMTDINRMKPEAVLDHLYSIINGVSEQKEEQINQIDTERPTDHVVGKEVVVQSSKKPLVVRPPLGATPKELSDHRIDKHRRLAHWISDKIAYATGPIDGFFDAIANGIGELVEDGAFFFSKIFYGAQHGWKRGRFPENQNG